MVAYTVALVDRTCCSVRVLQVQVAAYTNGREHVTEHDVLLLQYVIWTRPEDQDRVYDWLLSRLAADTDLKQTNYILASLFGRTCHALNVRTNDGCDRVMHALFNACTLRARSHSLVSCAVIAKVVACEVHCCHKLPAKMVLCRTKRNSIRSTQR